MQILLKTLDIYGIDSMTPAQQLLATRIVGFVLSIVWVTIITSWIMYYTQFVSGSKECVMFQYQPNIEMVKVDFKPGLNRRNQEFPYQLVEYVLYKRGLNQAEEHKEEIPVLFIPDCELRSENMQYLAKLVRERIREMPFRYRWYALEFGTERSYLNGDHIDLQLQFAAKVIRWMQLKHPDQKLVMIGHQYGGAIAFSAMTYFDLAEVHNMTDLMILESAPINRPAYEVDISLRHFYQAIRYKWEQKRQVKDVIGVVSYSNGIRDMSTMSHMTRQRDVFYYPTWTINHVPDAGIQEGGCFQCIALQHHIGDLLIKYGQEHREKTGHVIIKELYNKRQAEKEALLPEGWNRDYIPTMRSIKTGKYYEFNMDGQQWIKPNLIRDEFIWFTIVSDCVNHVTTIRSRKYIRRKPVNRIMDVGVFDVKRFEEVRFLLESNGTCHVSIETSPSWFATGQHFWVGVLRDSHQFFLASLMTATYLCVIEGQKPSERDEHHSYLYAIAFFFTAVQLNNAIGIAYVGYLVGFATTLFSYSVFSLLHNVIIYQYKRSIDKYFYDTIHASLNYCIVGFSMCTLVASNVGFCLGHALYVCLNRPYHIPTFFIGMMPMLGKIGLNTAVVWINPESLGVAHAVMAFNVFLHYVSEFAKPNYPQSFVHGLAQMVILLQVLHSDQPLEYHYGASMFLLVVNHHSNRKVPKTFRDAVIKIDKLEAELERMEKD